MGKLILVLGGARSGKSNFAMECAKRSNPDCANASAYAEATADRSSGRSVLYIATYKRFGDKEMEERIKNHKRIRPPNWKVVEEPIELSPAIKKRAKNFKTVLVDCITLWVSNLIFEKKSADEISARVQNLINTIKKANSRFIIVSNEVGLGVVPDTKLGREFRDIAGRVNQTIARSSNEVYFMVAGIPVKIKSVRVSHHQNSGGQAPCQGARVLQKELE